MVSVMREGGGIPVDAERAAKAKAPARLRLIAPVAAEVDTHAAIADALDTLLLPGTMWTTLPIGHVQLNGQQAARLARIGTHRGWFDILLIHAGSPYGLEIKREGAPLSRDRLVATRGGGRRVVAGQSTVFPLLLAAGCRIACVSSVEAALAALAEWGIPLRRWR